MTKKYKILFRMFGFGEVSIDAEDKAGALEGFDDLEMRQLIECCKFSSDDIRSSVFVVSVDGEEIEFDLDEVLADQRKRRQVRRTTDEHALLLSDVYPYGKPA